MNFKQTVLPRPFGPIIIVMRSLRLSGIRCEYKPNNPSILNSDNRDFIKLLSYSGSDGYRQHAREHFWDSLLPFWSRVKRNCDRHSAGCGGGSCVRA